MISYVRKGKLGENGQPEPCLSSRNLRSPIPKSHSASRQLYLAPQQGSSNPPSSPRTIDLVNTYGSVLLSSLSPVQSAIASQPLNGLSNGNSTSPSSTTNFSILSAGESIHSFPNTAIQPISCPDDFAVPYPQIFSNETVQHNTQIPALPNTLMMNQPSSLLPYTISPPMASEITRTYQEEGAGSSFPGHVGGFTLPYPWEVSPESTQAQVETPGEPYMCNLSHIISVQQSRNLPCSPPQQTTQYLLPAGFGEADGWPSICYECNNADAIYESLDAWSAHLTTKKHFGIWPSICYKCNGSGIIYENLSVWLVHVWTQHFNMSQWLPQSCLWMNPPCLNQKKFTNRKLWLDHVNGVHLKKFWCAVPDCELRQGGSQESPFGTPAYLKRHHESMHDIPIHCSKPFCAGRRSKLNRADKREEHAKWHGPFPCHFEGCSRRRIDGEDYGFTSQDLLDNHLRTGKHSPVQRRQT